jgi:beta-glucosidase
MAGQEGGIQYRCWKSKLSGKLTMTFPVKYEDTPSKKLIGTPAENPTSVTYEEGVYVGYRYFNTFHVKPSLFFYGLSYTNLKFQI